MSGKTGSSLSAKGLLATILGGLAMGWTTPSLALVIESGFVALSGNQPVEVQRGASGSLERIPANSMFRVQQGDVIRASVRTTVKIALSRDRDEEVTIDQNRPFPVAGQGVPSTVSDNMFRFLTAWLRPAALPETMQNITRGPDDDGATAPVRWRLNNNLVAGGRRLALAWSNIPGPVELTLRSDRNRTLAHLAGITGGKATLENSEGAFEANRLYRLTIKWQTDERTIDIRTYAPNAVPVLNPDRPDNPADAKVRGIVDAVRLAASDDGAWTLEAYQRLSALDSPVAALAAKQLAEGRKPPAPPPQ
ncbi:hypothetical protein AZL_a08670 (plasmid) [Azospirillum sp. B510]|uniref:hypothetical protein n=1 Tax=Azospirillum sp. (strain B510) TaxID=137722 RepID=UPI0001C4BB9B|nr:hypothetical protein [Azospirillum sp. B510]BAI74398.1 hypothetical protein AZL_a08670 [Azospirillum sp. B510]